MLTKIQKKDIRQANILFLIFYITPKDKLQGLFSLLILHIFF